MPEEHDVDGNVEGLIEEAHDPLGGRVDRCGDNGEHLSRVEFLWRLASEMPGECLVERDAWLIRLEQLDDVGVTELCYP